MKAKTFIVILSLFAIITLSLLLLYSLFASNTGGIIELYKLNHSKEILEIKLDSIVNSKRNLEKITGEEYFESLNYDGEEKNYFKDNYIRFEYIIYSNHSEKIIFRYNFIDSSLALVSATEEGKFFKLARDISYWDKYSFRVTFKREIVNKLNNKN